MLITATTTLFPKSSRLTTGTNAQKTSNQQRFRQKANTWEFFMPSQSNFFIMAVFLSLVFFRSRESEKFLHCTRQHTSNWLKQPSWNPANLHRNASSIEEVTSIKCLRRYNKMGYILVLRCCGSNETAFIGVLYYCSGRHTNQTPTWLVDVLME